MNSSTQANKYIKATSAASRINLLRRINWRLFAVFAIAAWLVGLPTYSYMKMTLSGGITRHRDLTEVDLKAMSNFDLDQENGRTEDVPKCFRDLDGKRVLLSGEMSASQNVGGRLGAFDLVYSIGKCCFAGPPKVQHFVKSRVKDGNRVDYREGVVNVTGTLHVGAEKADGRIQSVYRLEVERVDPYE